MKMQSILVLTFFLTIELIFGVTLRTRPAVVRGVNMRNRPAVSRGVKPSVRSNTANVERTDLSLQERRYLQERIDPLIKDIIGLRSHINSITANIHGLLTNIHAISADIKNLKSKGRSYATNIKGLEEHARSSAAEFKRFNSRIRTNAAGLKDIRSNIAAMKRSTTVTKRSTVSYPTPIVEWQKQLLVGEPKHISKGNLLTTLDTIDKEYKVTFEFNGPKMGRYGNILHMTIEGDDNSKYGDCTPCVYYNGGMLEISSAVNGNGYFYKTAAISPNTWHSIEISQEQVGSTYYYAIGVDGTIISRVPNSKPAIFRKVKVFGSDPWYNPQTGYIRNLYIQHKAKKLNSAKTYYDEYKALFAGFGYSAASTSQQKLSMQHSLEECLLVCYTKHETDKSWDGVRYASMTKDCICIQNSQGHVKTKNDLHYKFVN